MVQINRNSHLRQSLQRKPVDPSSAIPSSNPLIRGGIRGSLQSSSVHRDLNQSHRNSFPGIEQAADITVNSLGQPGTRRTVYLIDETQKLPDTGNNSQSSSGSSSKGGAQANNNSSGDTPNVDTTPPPPNTFLMFNKISNVTMQEPVTGTSSLNGSEEKAPSESGSKNGGKKPKGDSKNRESAIWYEYGCV